MIDFHRGVRQISAVLHRHRDHPLDIPLRVCSFGIADVFFGVELIHSENLLADSIDSRISDSTTKTLARYRGT